jgi:hypothetical protein
VREKGTGKCSASLDESRAAISLSEEVSKLFHIISFAVNLVKRLRSSARSFVEASDVVAQPVKADVICAGERGEDEKHDE